jgi:RNA polymerase sigma factor (sigma-70 family)
MDSEIRGSRSIFPPTRYSVVRAATGHSAVRQQALEALVTAYWKPVYKYIRMQWSASAEDAKDLTQDFFAAAIEKAFFDAYDSSRSKFRTYLRTCVDGLVANSRKASLRVKRGGQARILPLDFDAAENELSRAETHRGMRPDEFFEREWIRNMFDLAINDLRERCHATGRHTHFALFERYDLDPPVEGRLTYAQLAAEFQLPVTQVTNYLAFARSELRRCVLERLGRITASDQEFQSEARHLLGVELR